MKNLENYVNKILVSILMKYKFLCYILTLKNTFSLIPFNNHKKYLFNRNNPASDLKIIDYKRADVIAKKWLDNIVASVVNDHYDKLNKNEGLYNYDEVFMVNKINEFRNDTIYSKDNIYLIWMPRGLFSVSEVLYIISMEKCENSFKIKYLVQSPYWNHKQIKSKKLKYSLINQGEINNKTIDFSYLYENDIRHKLEWYIWDINMDNNIL